MNDWQMANRDFISREFAKSMGAKSRAATRHDVPHKEARRLYDRGLSDLNIAAVLGVSKGDVYKWRKNLGLISNTIRLREVSRPVNRKKNPPEK